MGISRATLLRTGCGSQSDGGAGLWKQRGFSHLSAAYPVLVTPPQMAGPEKQNACHKETCVCANVCELPFPCLSAERKWLFLRLFLVSRRA